MSFLQNEVIDTANEGEEGGNGLSFAEWIDDNGLQPIKDIFIKYGITTLDNLTENNSNFSQLITEVALGQEAYLIQNIKSGIKELKLKKHVVSISNDLDKKSQLIEKLNDKICNFHEDKDYEKANIISLQRHANQQKKEIFELKNTIQKLENEEKRGYDLQYQIESLQQYSKEQAEEIMKLENEKIKSNNWQSVLKQKTIIDKQNSKILVLEKCEREQYEEIISLRKRNRKLIKNGNEYESQFNLYKSKYESVFLEKEKLRKALDAKKEIIKELKNGINYKNRKNKHIKDVPSDDPLFEFIKHHWVNIILILYIFFQPVIKNMLDRMVGQ